MGFHNGPVIVTDSLIFNFDAGNDKCTDSDDEVTSMRDIGLVAHSSRTDRGITGAGTTASFSFPTNVGATKTIDLGITGRNSDTDSTNYDNRLGFDDDIVIADQSAWSAEFWIHLRDNATVGFQSLAGRGATNNWFIFQADGSGGFYPRFRDNDSVYRRSSGNETRTGFNDWHQVAFTCTTGRVLSFYADGTSMGGSVTIADSALQINRIMAGYASGTARYGLEGSMLCARIYSKALSAAEVLQNFDATRGRVGI
jgi:hypothetical protein